MKKEQVLDLMNAVPADLVEEADGERPVKRRLPRVVRTGLIAACVCLALMGTAFAGIKGRTPVHLEPHIDSAGVFDGYSVTGDLAYYPISRFSDAFREAGASGTSRVNREFSSFEEVQAFLGENIPCIWPQDWEADYLVSLYHDEQGDIWGTDVISYDREHKIDIIVEIQTDKYPRDTGGRLYGGFGDKERLESYEMPNGCVADGYTLNAPDYDDSRCVCFFISDGNLYSIAAYGTPEHQAELWPRIQSVLDRFS